MATVLTDSNFQTEVLESDKVVLVDLWAEWCGPCKMMNPVMEQLSKQYEGKAIIGKLNVDENSEVPFKYNVRGIPTFLVFKNGELKDKIVGAVPASKLTATLDSLV